MKIRATVAILALLVAEETLAQAFAGGDVLLRAGATTTDPREDSDPVRLNGGVVSLAGGQSGIGINSDTQLGVNLEYFFSATWGLELLAATPFRHEAEATGELAGLKLADFKHLPPTLSAVYHFRPLGALQPYFGAGLNYTFLFDEELSGEADAAFSGLGLTGGKVKLDDSFGVSLQIGADLHLDERWLLNASVRWIDLETDAEIRFAGGNKVTSTIAVDPYVYTLSLGYRF